MNPLLKPQVISIPAVFAFLTALFTWLGHKEQNKNIAPQPAPIPTPSTVPVQPSPVLIPLPQSQNYNYNYNYNAPIILPPQPVIIPSNPQSVPQQTIIHFDSVTNVNNIDNSLNHYRINNSYSPTLNVSQQNLSFSPSRTKFFFDLNFLNQITGGLELLSLIRFVWTGKETGAVFIKQSAINVAQVSLLLSIHLSTSRFETPSDRTYIQPIEPGWQETPKLQSTACPFN